MKVFRNAGAAFYGVVGMLTLLLLVAAAVAVPRTVTALSTTGYVAELAGAAGIAEGDDVRVAGVTAGEVTSIALAGDRVRVAFRIDDDQPLHADSTGAVKVATVLGTRYLSVRPGHGEPIPAGSTIPLDRTSVPYSLGKLAKDGGETAQRLNLSALRSAMDVLRDSAPDPRAVGDAVEGITGVARMVNKRDGQLEALLDATQSVTSNVLSQRETLVQLLGDARGLARVVSTRQDTINKLITDVHSLAGSLRRVLADTEGELNPLLSDLHALTDSLRARNAEIGKTLELLGPASRYLANATGNGPWGDVSGPAGPLPDNLLCVAGLLKGCR